MTIFLTILAIAFLILIHELGHFLVAKWAGVRVDEFGIGFPPRLFGKKLGETTYSINILPLGGFVRLHGETAGEEPLDSRSFILAKAWRRALVIIAGVAMNFMAGWLIISTVFFVGTPQMVVVEEVLPQSAAEAAGLKAGDIILGFRSGGEPFSLCEREGTACGEGFVNFIKSHQGQEISLNINRDGKEQVIKSTPRVVGAGEGALGVKIADAGVAPHGLLASLKEGLSTSLNIIGSVFYGLWSILITFFGQGKLLEGFVGPVGVFGMAAKSAQIGFIFLLQLIGIISLNLAALNILPFPALDGGRLLFIIFEKIKGSRLSPRFEQIANSVGFLLLIAMILAVTIRDVARIF